MITFLQKFPQNKYFFSTILNRMVTLAFKIIVRGQSKFFRHKHRNCLGLFLSKTIDREVMDFE